MSGQNETTVPGQGAGQAPQPISGQPQPGATPAGAPQESGSQPGTQQPQYVTREQLDREKAEILRQAQSFSDKGTARIQKQMQAFEQSLQTMKGLGQTITPEMESQLRAKAYSEALKEPAPQPGPEGNPPAQAAPQTQAVNPVVQEAMQIQQSVGATVEETDPEAKMIIFDKGSYQFLKSVETAALAKKQRLASGGPTEPETNAGNPNPETRLPPSGGPARKKLTPKEKISKGLRQVH